MGRYKRLDSYVGSYIINSLEIKACRHEDDVVYHRNLDASLMHLVVGRKENARTTHESTA